MKKKKKEQQKKTKQRSCETHKQRSCETHSFCRAQQQQQPADSPPSKAGDFLTTSAELLKDGGMFLLNESREAAKNDPALGLRLAANRFDAEFLDGTGNVAEGFSGMAVAFVRGGLLGANVFRATNTFKDPNAKLYHKALDVGRIATDLVGLAGAVMTLAVPSMAETGRGMTQFAYGRWSNHRPQGSSSQREGAGRLTRVSGSHFEKALDLSSAFFLLSGEKENEPRTLRGRGRPRLSSVFSKGDNNLSLCENIFTRC